jgi:hypothetical protein
MADTAQAIGNTAGNPAPEFTAMERSPWQVYRTRSSGFIVTGADDAIDLFRTSSEGVNCSMKMCPAMARALARELLAAADALEGAAA